MNGTRSKIATALALILAVLGVLIILCPAEADAGNTISITELVNNMKKYDGREVTTEGEVIGDFMVRGRYAWITVNDDAYSETSLEEGGKFEGLSNMGIGIWTPTEPARAIGIFGGYKNKGDKVRITGTFHRACVEHGGDTDIHATTLEVLKTGYRFPKHFQYVKLLVALILAGASAFLWSRLRQKKRQALKKG